MRSSQSNHDVDDHHRSLMSMHPLLARQLKRMGLEAATLPPSPDTWQKLLERVSQSYTESDQGHELLERSIALSFERNAGSQRAVASGPRRASSLRNVTNCTRFSGRSVTDSVWSIKIGTSCCSIPKASASVPVLKPTWSAARCLPSFHCHPEQVSLNQSSPVYY